MKRLLNTLFVLTQGAYLAKEGETVLVRVRNETKLRVPVHGLGGVVCFGNVLCSPFLLGMCAENDVGVSFLTERGRFLARLEAAGRNQRVSFPERQAGHSGGFDWLWRQHLPLGLLAGRTRL